MEIVGRYNKKEFSVKTRLVEKTRRKWKVELMEESEMKLDSLPSSDHRLEVMIILNHEGLMPDVLAGPWVKRLKRAEKKTEMDLSTMVKLGLAKSTRLEHQRKLRDLEYLKPSEGEFLVTCLLRYFEEEQKWREWEGSTLCANMASTQGALASLPLYRKGMEPILLKVSPEWRLGLKGAGSLARRRVGTSKYTPKIATLKDIRKAMKMEPNPITRAAIELGWVTASRGGCLTKLRTGNVQLDDKVSSVRFAEGKTASHRPYTIHTTPVSWETQDYVEKRTKEIGQGSWLFPGLRGEHIKRRLRRADPRYLLWVLTMLPKWRVDSHQKRKKQVNQEYHEMGIVTPMRPPRGSGRP